MTAHTIEEALDAFELIAGVGSEANRQACAMSLLAWVNGDEWGDAMSCAHPLIRSLVVQANDAPDTTAEDRAELVRLGEYGVIETWWVPTEVVVAALAVEDGLDPLGPLDAAKRVLTLVADWKASTDKVRPDLGSADIGSADLWGADLGGANLRGADLWGANLWGSRGDQYTVLPDAYRVTADGMIVRGTA